MPNFRDLHRREQSELDACASRRSWDRGRFKSWKFRGFTISVSANGYPRRRFVASKDGDAKEFDDLDELLKHVMRQRQEKSAD